MANTKDNKVIKEVKETVINSTFSALTVTSNENRESALSVFSKPIQTSFSKLIKATVNMNKNSWTYVDTIVKIVDDKLFVADFTTQGRFADFMGISAGALSQMVNASHYATRLEKVEIIDENGNKTKVTIRDNMTWSRAYLMSTIINSKDLMLKDDALMAKLNKFDEYCNENNLSTKSDADVKKAIKAYKNRNKHDLPKEEVKEETVRAYINGKVYDLPVSVLNKYEVKKDENEEQ